MAFAGFSPGEAEGLRRAMSRKRSVEAIEAFHERFLDGAAAPTAPPPILGKRLTVGPPRSLRGAHPVTPEIAERVWSMIEGFSGFGFPKAHGAAFGLLAYQSTWLRVHYGPEFLASLLNEQPMGFYASDTLSHEAQRRGIEMLPPDVNESEVECVVVRRRDRADPPAADPNRVRLGLAYVLGARSAELEALVEARRERRALPLAGRPGVTRGRRPRRARAPRVGGRVRLAGRRARARRAGGRRCGSSASPCRRGGGGGGHAALAAARDPAGAAARAAGGVGRDGGRLRDDRPDARPASDGARAPVAAARARSRSPTSRRFRTRSQRAPRRPGRRAPAAGHGQGHRVPAARGRVRDGQPDRPAAGLRPPSPDRAGRAAGHDRGPAGAAARSPAGRSTSWSTRCARSRCPTRRRPRSCRSPRGRPQRPRRRAARARVPRARRPWPPRARAGDEPARARRRTSAAWRRRCRASRRGRRDDGRTGPSLRRAPSRRPRGRRAPAHVATG